MATSVPPVPGKLGKARSCCWTLNNYNDDNIATLRRYATTCRYMVFGYEIAPTSGTPHLQGYISWDGPRSLDKFKSDISQSLHLERTRGTPQQASDYCKKEGKFEEFGQLPAQGERTDWRAAVEQLKSGEDVEAVVVEQPQLLPAIRALERFKAMTLKPKHRDIKVYVLYGDSGAGKSTWAYEYDPELFSKSRGDWWDGYSGQKTVLMDDYYGYLPYSELLRVLDRYPYHAPIKGGFVWAQWETVIITSNKHPSEWYSQGMTPALERRLTEIKYMQKV